MSDESRIVDEFPLITHDSLLLVFSFHLSLFTLYWYFGISPFVFASLYSSGKGLLR